MSNLRQAAATPERAPRWAKVVDHASCIGCHACTTACKSENEVPVGVTRTYVKSVDVGFFPQARRAFQVSRCNQCDDAPCTTACPTTAMYRRDDGIVDFDKSICIGCKACSAACPYDAIFINPEDHSAEKCNFCAHRIDVGLEPACVTVCPTEAIMVGDINDPASRVAQMVHREPVAVRRPEKETRPKLFYRGAHQATLDPLAAKRPEGGLFMWSEQTTGGDHVVSGHPGDVDPGGPPNEPNNSSAAAVLSYDVPHKAPWDWRVSLYTLTKGVAAGAYLVPLLLVVFGLISQSSALWVWAAPIVAGVFLGLTGALLIWDLEHPGRFYYIFTRPQWRSWLVRGGFIILGYSGVLAAHFVASLLNWSDGHRLLMWLGLPLASMTAIYTAWLFAQAKARDLWQSPLLPPHLMVQTLLAGSAALLPVALNLDSLALGRLIWLLAFASLAHLLMVWGESALPHVTAHAHLANREMVRGRYGGYFWAGIALVAAGMLAPWIGWPVAPLALVGLAAFEHAYVQAGQSVPLA
ncbi:MAG: polysulfide reductase NrfD [bacterium]|nr:polysulfide reductase NrfD [bacterium]